MWLVTLESVQNFLIGKTSKYLSEKLKTEVRIDHVHLGFFNKFNISGVYVEDLQQDTLLYVGNLSIKSTDLLKTVVWKNKAIIKSIELDDIFVHLYRAHDTTCWNYDFIAEAFGVDIDRTDTTTKTIEETKKSENTNSHSGPSIGLEKVKLNNVRFYMDDAWRGEDLRFSIGELDLKSKKLDLTSNQMFIDYLGIDKADVTVLEYEGGKPEDLTPDDTTSWGTPFNPDNFALVANRIKLTESSFQYHVGTDLPLIGEFDEDHIEVSELFLDLENTRIVADTIFSDLQWLHAKERCGLTIEDLHANIKLSQVQAQLSEMALKTKHSYLADFFEMDYKNFHAYEDFLEGVTLVTKLSQSKISSLDIAYFAPILREYPITVDIDAVASGKIGDINVRDIELKTLNSHFKGHSTIVGLPDIDEARFSVLIDQLQTNGKDINQLVPQTKTSAVDWNTISSIKYSGQFSGRAMDFETKGMLATNMGNIDMNMKMNFYPLVPTYSGFVKSDGIQLGNFLKNTSLGSIALESSIDGQGFDLADLNTKVNTKIKHINFDGNNYKDLYINGFIAKRKFDGIFVSHDPNLAVNFDGKIDLSGKVPEYKFNTRLISINLKTFGIVENDMIATGYASMNFAGDNIDNFTGSIHIENMKIDKGADSYFIEDLTIKSVYEDNLKVIRMNSSLADAEIKGVYNISELGTTVQTFMYHYLPDYIKKPGKFSPADFTYWIKIKETDELISLFTDKIHHISNIYISGALNSNLQKLSIDVNMPSFGYDNILIRDFYLVSAGDFNELDLNAVCGNVLYDKEIIIPSFQLNTNMANDTATLNFTSQSINDIFGEAVLNCKARAFNENLFINVLPSSVSIKNDKWQLNSVHDIIVGKQIEIKDFFIESGAQKFTINTRSSDHKNIEVDFKNIDLEGATSYAGIEDVKLYGRISGLITVKEYLENPEIELDLKSNDVVRINDELLGIVNAGVSYHVQKETITFLKKTSIQQKESEAKIEGFVNLKDHSSNLVVDIKNVNISSFSPFVSEYIDNLKGNANGNIIIEGDISSPEIKGNMNLKDITLKVLFLGTKYTSPSVDFTFSNNNITMSNMILYDERNSSKYMATIQGKIRHKNFKNIALNFSAKSSNFLCLNTKAGDNELFYGYVPAELNMQLTGNIDDITASIQARPLKDSKFYLPIGSSGDASSYEYVTFASFGKSQLETTDNSTPNYFKLNMNIDATPDAEAHIILDQNTGEEIIAKGNGAIKLNLDLGNSMNMFGTYVITEGKYLFNFRGLIPREFIIDENSKITWTGDPLAADMDVKAVYKIPKPLALYPLVSAQANSLDEADKSEAKRTYPTFVILGLKGSLSQPSIKFDITQPDNRAVGTSAFTRFEQIKNDEKELITQASLLLLLGEFKGSDGVSSSAYRSGSISTVSDLVGSAVSSEVTNLIQKITGLKNISVNLAYQTTGIESQLNSGMRNELSVNVSTSLLKDRILVDFGNSVDISRDAGGRTNSNFIGGDFKAQFLISEDGRLRANAYRINNLDVSGQNFTRSGTGISYKRVFDNFEDLFARRKRKQVIFSAPIHEDSIKTTP